MTRHKLNVDLDYINSTNEILTELNECILKKKPFSIIRFGDAIYGIVSVYRCPNLIDSGKWKGRKGKRLSRAILGQLTIPQQNRRRLCRRIVIAANRANFIDSYDAYRLLNRRRLGILGRKWKEIHSESGINNTSYCSCFIHYFSIVDGEYNLLDIMKNRRIFCITSQLSCINKLREVSGASVIDTYQIPRRGRKGRHYKDHFRKIMSLIQNNAKRYDLFLIGAGFLGKIYCDEVKRCGGRSFDAGRLFDFWSGTRQIDSAPKRFLKYNSKKMLCERKRQHSTGVW